MLNIRMVLFLVLAFTATVLPQTDNMRVARLNNVRKCDYPSFSGATAGAKTATCIANIPATGGTADLRGFEGAQSWTTCPFTGITKPVRALLGASTITLSANCTIASNITLDWSPGSIISVNTGITLTINGAMDGSPTQRFAGAGTVVLASTRIPEVYPEWWGANASDAVNDATAIQSALTASCANGSKIIKFGAGSTIPGTSRAYILGASSVNVTCGEVKLTGPKYTMITKTGASDFFTLAIGGYGFEAENLALVGDESVGQVGFRFSGSAPTVGILNANIHDMFFSAVGDKDTADETAGGAVLITAETLGFRFSDNIITGGGYTVRNTIGSDGMKITHNVSNISKSLCYQFIDTVGAASIEVSNNNCANVGGFMYARAAGYLNVFGNEAVPGESGSLGDMVKRDYSTTSLAENGGGASAMYVFYSSQNPRIHDNLCAIGAAGITGDYCYWFSNTQGPGAVYMNISSGGAIAGFRTSPQFLTYINNVDAISGTLYSNSTHSGILNYKALNATDASWSFGTDAGTVPFEIAGPAAIVPTTAISHFKISNAADPNEFIGLGWNDANTTGYIQCNQTGTGTGYATCNFRSPSLFSGADGDTRFNIQNGTGQGSKPFRILSSAGAELFGIALNGAANGLTFTSVNGYVNGTTVVWQQGAGAPGGACANGSMYSRTTGGPPNLYVCEATAWVGK